jgi:subtilisin-like proprotein convertase family protein
LYNALPDGLGKADVNVAGNASTPSAAVNGFGNSGMYVNLAEDFKTKAFASSHSMQSFAHELGHYIYGLRDSYGGQVLDSTGTKLPLEFLAATAQNSPFGAGRQKPASLNFRTYMWSDSWLRYRVNGFSGQTLSGPAMYGGPVLYEPSGRKVGSDFPNGSIMSFALGSNSFRDNEYSTVSSHLGATDYTFRMPSYTYKNAANASAVRAADATAKIYTLVNNQHDGNAGKSEWEMVAGYLGLSAPTTISAQTLAEVDMPEVILVDGAAIMLCIDRSGSMSAENRMALAQSGANAALSQFRLRNATTSESGHYSGLVSFDNATSVNVPVQELANEGVRTTIRSAVNGLAPGGSTSIGGGLRGSLNQLLTLPDKTKAIILLSDGEHNSGEAPAAVIPDLVANGVKVYTIALGNSADTSTLGSIASQTGGEMRFTSSGTDLTQFFTDLVSKLNSAGSSTSSDVLIAKGQTYQESSYVEPGANRLVFTFKSSNPALKTSLRSPKGKIITPASVVPGITYVNGEEFDSFELTGPEAGTWALSLANITGTSGNLGQVNKSEAPPLAILDNTTVTSQLNVSSTGIVAGLQVGVNITHSYIGDLEITLISPTGTRILLHDNSGGGTDNLVGTFGTTFTSVDSLNKAFGQAAQGTWSLEVKDTTGGDTGLLNNWFIKFAPATASTTTTAEVIVTTQNNALSVNAKAEPTTLVYPNPVKITCNITAFGSAVAGVNVFADVYTPEGSHFYLPLYDDGKAEHGDAEKNDGSYNVLYNSYSSSGSYTFVVNAINKTGYAVSNSDQASPGTPPVATPVVPPFERTVTSQCTVTGVPEEQIEQFVMDYFNAINSTTAGTDSFDIRGTFNSLPISNFNGLLEAFTFNIGGAVSYTIPSGGWKRVARYQRYTRIAPGETGIFSYFIGGSSKCSYSYKRSKITLDSGLTNPANTAISVSRLGQWTKSVNVMLDSVGNVRRYSGKHTQPDLFVTTASCTLVKTKVGGDSLTFSARAEGPFAFDPVTNGIEILIGPFYRLVPAGAFTRSRNLLTHRASTPFGGTVVITYDIETQLLRATVTKEDLGLVATQPLMEVQVALTGIAGASWKRKLGMAPNSSRTIFRY